MACCTYDIHNILVDICDAIKQNESELEKTKIKFYIVSYASYSELYYAETPIKIDLTLPEV